jgi:hypothetical protein
MSRTRSIWSGRSSGPLMTIRSPDSNCSWVTSAVNEITPSPVRGSPLQLPLPVVVISTSTETSRTGPENSTRGGGPFGVNVVPWRAKHASVVPRRGEREFHQ